MEQTWHKTNRNVHVPVRFAVLAAAGVRQEGWEFQTNLPVESLSRLLNVKSF
jgi:hypothetical protein